MQLAANEIHLWLADLSPYLAQEAANRAILSEDECQRADRFRFVIHRQRYVAARFILRTLLSRYLTQPAATIQLGYTDHQKPYLLEENPDSLQFNLSHSDSMALYAFTVHHAIGVDIEQVKNQYDEGIPKRFFSASEQAALAMLPAAAFYRVWARKEAILKAIGKGLTLPLDSFSVSAEPIAETIELENQQWSLLPVEAPSTFQAAVASNQIVEKVTQFLFNE